MDTENNQDTIGPSDVPSEPKRIILKPRRVDYPRRDRVNREEYAEEISPLSNRVPNITREITDQAGGKTMGYVGLAFGIASLFMWSVILGPVAAVIGYFAYGRGQKTTGAWAMGLGIVAALSYFVMIPFAR